MRYDATANAVEATGLVKRFGKTTALDGVDLVARPGRVLGVLGPNGAGKTTAVRILATLLRPDSGQVSVCGYDVLRDAHQVRQLIGLTGQYASVDEGLSGTNNLIMIGRLLGMPRADARDRAGELLARFELTEAGRAAGQDLLGRHATPGSTWRPAWSATPGCCTWTSRRPDSTSAAGPMSGAWSAGWSRTGSRSC